MFGAKIMPNLVRMGVVDEAVYIHGTEGFGFAAGVPVSAGQKKGGT